VGILSKWRSRFGFNNPARFSANAKRGMSAARSKLSKSYTGLRSASNIAEHSSPRSERSSLPYSSASGQNIRAICDLEHSALAERSAGERLADRIASIAGKASFAVAHAFLFFVWLTINLGGMGQGAIFDPYPFQLLTLVTSLEAIFLSLFILTSQNRATSQADQRSHLDLQINLLAEEEATATLKMLQALCAHHGLEIANDPALIPLVRRTEPKILLKEIQTELPDGS